MKNFENKKIEKNKTYTYEEIKEIFDNAQQRTLEEPFGNEKELKEKPTSEMKLGMLLTGMILTHTLEDNLFEKEKKDAE